VKPWKKINLASLEVERVRSVDPRKTPSKSFLLYSIPAHDAGAPEAVHGRDVGSPKKETVPGRVLLSGLNPRISRVRIVEDADETPLIASSEWFQFDPTSDLLPQFLAYQLQQEHLRQHFATNVSGVGGSLTRLRGTALHEVDVVAPTIEVQLGLVAAIEMQFSRLDATVATLIRLKTELKRARASVLKSAVEGRLVPTEAAVAKAERREYEQASALLARTPPPPRPNRYNSRSTDVVPGHAALSIGDTGAALPEGWSRAAMVDVAKMESGHTPSRRHPEWWGGEVPWITLTDAREHHGGTILRTAEQTNEMGLENSAARLLPVGTVCVSRTASVGYVVVMGSSMATSQDFVNWVPTGAVSSNWLRIVFQTDREVLIGFGKGSVHRTIYFPEMLALHLAVPPLAEQRRIVEEVDRRLSVLESLGTTLDLCIARCFRLRQAILKTAFEGRLIDPGLASKGTGA
jgi:type I restriction enzyme S subunit